MTLYCADKAFPVTCRAVRAVIAIGVVVAALSISGVAQASPERASGTETPELAKGSSRLAAPGTFRKFAVPTFIALQSLDAGATEYGFHQRNWIEHNPMIPHSTAGRMTYFGLTGAGVVFGSSYLERKGHRRWAKALLVGGIAVEGYAATHTLIGLQK